MTEEEFYLFCQEMQDFQIRNRRGRYNINYGTDWIRDWEFQFGD